MSWGIHDLSINIVDVTDGIGLTTPLHIAFVTNYVIYMNLTN